MSRRGQRNFKKKKIRFWKRIREIEAIQEANVAYTDEDHKVAGCIVSISHNGEPRLETGLVRPEDLPEPEATPSDQPGEESAFDNEDAVSAGPNIELPQAMQRSDVPINATDSARKEQGIPRALADDLRATRHQIIRAHMAADYDTAYDAMLYAMRHFSPWQLPQPVTA